MSHRPALVFGALLIAAVALAPARAADVTCRILDPKGAGVADAVVSLIPLDAPAAPTVPAGQPEIVQKGREFIPFVTVVRAGTSIHFPNRDTVEHYVYSRSPAKTFQFPLYAPGKNEVITFDHPGVIALGCNIHDWMLAYVVVVDTPWYVHVPAKGEAVIPGVPPGRYRAEVWHWRLRRVETRELVIPAGAPTATVQLTLTLGPDHRIRRPTSAGLGGYR